MNSYLWQKHSSISEDMAIACVCCEPDRPEVWLASSSGLFYSSGDRFELKLTGSISAVQAVEKALVATQSAGGILYSPDSGVTWFASRMERAAGLVTCFVPSPNFRRDATLLAGNDGEGILRSTDGGRSWQASNFGLRSLNVLGLGWAPAWQPAQDPFSAAYIQDIVFAATDHGVYRSPNGGRAWQSCSAGLPEAAVLALAVSQNFKRYPISRAAVQFDGVVFAGTDGSGLHRSPDGGQTWQAVPTFPGQSVVNALQFDLRGNLWAATGQDGLLVSPDLGETWRLVMSGDRVILCLAMCGTTLWAGTAGSGLWRLTDADQGEGFFTPSCSRTANF